MAGDAETKAAILRVNQAIKSGTQPTKSDSEIVGRMARQDSFFGGLGGAAKRAQEGKLGSDELQ